MTLVGPCVWCLFPGVTTLLSSSSTGVSGACLYVTVAAGHLHRFSHGAHEMLSLVRTAWRREMWAWLLFVAPGSKTALPVNRTDFELLCRTPLRNVSKSFISGLAHENVLCVQVRSVSGLQPPCYAYNVMPVVYIHVVWCCTEVFRPWVQFGSGICVSRSFAVFW